MYGLFVIDFIGKLGLDEDLGLLLPEQMLALAMYKYFTGLKPPEN
jgi:hypothetical protein